MKIMVVKNHQALSRLAANLMIKRAKQKPNLVLGLATGNTVVGFFCELVRAYLRKKISFKKIKTFGLDEFVGLGNNDRGSLFYYMHKHFFDHVDLNPKNIFMLDGRAKNLNAECKDFEKQIAKSEGIGIQILGIGLNGHIGWNEPGSSFKSKTRVLNLTLQSRRSHQKNFENLRHVPKQAMTMGIGTIMKAKQIILMASGKDKAAIVRKALKGKISRALPASILQTHPNVIIILDQAAASKL